MLGTVVRYRLWLAVAIICTSALGLMVLGGVIARCSASSVQKDPEGRMESPADENDIENVDWDYWASVNPDIVAWITVPGTAIDYPIVQAVPDFPQFYLDHDAYRNLNFYGCPYIAAECTSGLESPNCVVYGHNMGFGDHAMFADFAAYADANYARDHRDVILQTPRGNRLLHAACSQVIPGWSASKKTEFTTSEDLCSWYTDTYDSCDTQIDIRNPSPNVFTFCTCSYTRWSDERTLVFAL